MHDPFIKLTHIFTGGGIQRKTPLYMKPERITEMVDGTVYMDNQSFAVLETAEQMHQMVLEKSVANKQAEVLG